MIAVYTCSVDDSGITHRILVQQAAAFVESIYASTLSVEVQHVPSGFPS